MFMAKENSFIGASLFDIRIAVIIGVLILIGGTVTAYLITDNFESDLSIGIVSDYNEIVKIAAGGGLIILGIGVGSNLSNKNAKNNNTNINSDVTGISDN